MANKMAAKTKTGAQTKGANGARKMRKPSDLPKNGAKTRSVMAKKTKQPRSAKKQGKKNHKKAWIIAGVVLILVTLAGVACAVFIPPLFQPKYGESYSLAVDIKAKLEDMYSEKKAPCQEVMDSWNDEDVSVDRFEKMIDGCRSELEETRELVNQLGESSGIVKDEALKKKFDKFAKSAESTVPNEEKIEKGLEAYRVIHEFGVRMDEFADEADGFEDFDEETVKSITKVLIEYDDDALAEIGTGYEQRMLKIAELYRQAMRAIEENNYTEFNRIYAEMTNATDEFEKWWKTQRDVIENKDWLLDEDSIEVTKKDFDDLYKAIREMYEKHYDGKNEVECSKKGDGVVKCK